MTQPVFYCSIQRAILSSKRCLSTLWCWDFSGSFECSSGFGNCEQLAVQTALWQAKTHVSAVASWGFRALTAHPSFYLLLMRVSIVKENFWWVIEQTKSNPSAIIMLKILSEITLRKCFENYGQWVGEHPKYLNL